MSTEKEMLEPPTPTPRPIKFRHLQAESLTKVLQQVGANASLSKYKAVSPLVNPTQAKPQGPKLSVLNFLKRQGKVSGKVIKENS